MSEFSSTADAENQHADDRRRRSAVPPIRATDGERLMRFWLHRDETAFAEVVELHAGLVWGVCSQVLRRREDVEDAFQATFLILARKAKSIRAADSAAGWLYRVAFRTSLLARNRRLRITEESLVHEPATDDDQLEAITRNEQCLVLLEELHALPMQYRQPLVLCYLEGRTRSEAADELGVTPQTVKGALARGTRMLRSRLVSRGAALSTTMAVVSASMVSAQAAAPPMLVSQTAALGAGFALKLAGAGATATAVKGGAATILAEKGILAMTIAAASKPAVAVLGVCLTAGMLAVATADAPKGGVDSEATVVLLADSDAGESPNGEGASADADAEFSADAEATASVNGNQNRDAEDPGVATIAAGSSDNPFAAPATVPAVPGQPAAAPTIPAPPAAISFAAAGVATSNDPPLAAPPMDSTATGWWKLVPTIDAQAVADSAAPVEVRVENQTAVTTPTRMAGPSEASLKLEVEYWNIKGRALKKKAAAIAAHARTASESGRQSTTETATAEAEAELTLAEVKLCELNALRAAETLEVLEVGKVKLGDKGPRVEALQRALNVRVSPPPQLDVDGDFGGLTQKAVMSFQKAHGLKADGKVDAATAAVLGSWEFAAPNSAFDLSQSFADEARRQQALMQAKAMGAEVLAKQAAEGAVAAAANAGRQAEQAAKAEIREERIIAGGARTGYSESVPGPSTRIIAKPEALIEMERQLTELQKANEKLEKQLQEFESNQPSRY